MAAAGIVNSAVALGAHQSFIDARVPLIIATAGANDLTGAKGSEFIWRTSFANAEKNYAMGKWLAQQPPIPGGVFLLAPEYVAGHEQLNGFKAAFVAGGGKIAGEQYSPFGITQDFQPYLTQVRASGAGAIYAFYAGQDAIGFVRQYRDFGLAGRIPLYGPGFLTEGPTLAAQGAAAEGIMTVLHYSDQLDTPDNRDFVEAYEAVYKAPPTAFSVQAYDAGAVLDAALAQIDGAVSGAALVAALPKVGEIDSPRGAWRFSPRRNPEQRMYLRQVRRDGDEFVNAVVEDLGPVDPAAHGRQTMTGWLSDNLVSILNGVALGCLLFALAVGLSLVFGVLDVLNLAHGSLFVAGAYAAWRLADDGSLAGFGLAVVLAAGIGGAGGLAAHRRHPPAGRPEPSRSGVADAGYRPGRHRAGAVMVRP